MKEILCKLEQKLSKFEKRYIIIIAVALLIFIPYLSKGIIRGDDYICHMANIFSIDRFISIKDFVFFPAKINPIMANNLGYGNAIFYPQLAYLTTVLINMVIKHFGFTIISSVKVFEFLLVTLSGITMYKFVDLAFKNKDAALASSIIYMCSPYFLCDLFRRMAYSEIGIFVFMPIVFASIYYLINNEYKKTIIYFTLGYVGMLSSHLVLTCFFTIFIIIILLFNIKKIFNKRSIISLIFATILTICIMSSSILPMLEHKIKGNYVVFKDGEMTNIEKLHSQRLTLNQIINNNEKNSLSTYISKITLVLIGVSIIGYKKLKTNNIQKRIFLGIFLFGAFSIILCSNVINWNLMPKPLWNIQFPWRMCSFIAFASSVIAGIALIHFEKEDTRKLILILICIFCLTDVAKIVNYNFAKVYEPVKYKEVMSLKDRACGGQKEYLPVNAKNNLDYLNTRDNSVKIIDGDIEKIEIIKNKTPYLQFEIITNNKNNIKIELPRIFYYGYEIKYESDKEKIEYYENENGLIEFNTNKSGIITVKYTGTKLNKFARTISICSIIIYLLFIYYSRKDIKIIGVEKIGKF